MLSLQKGQLGPGNEDAAAAMQLFAEFAPDREGWRQLCEGLAELMELAGKPDECDRLCKLAIAASKPSGVDRGDLEFYYAKFLFGQDRLDEAEVHAIEALRAPCGEIGFAQRLLKEIRAAKTSR